VIGPGARAAARAVNEHPSTVDVTGGAAMNSRAGRLGSRKRIGVIATESTVHSKAYTSAIGKLDPEALVIERACPLFVPLAEEGWADTEVARAVAVEYLQDLKSNIDTLVLGCTHYPILKPVIRETVGGEVRLIDSGEAAAREVKALLAKQGLARRAHEKHAPERQLCDDLDHFYVTDAQERFARVAERFLGSQPARLEEVEVWGRDELRWERRSNNL